MRLYLEHIVRLSHSVCVLNLLLSFLLHQSFTGVSYTFTVEFDSKQFNGNADPKQYPER